MRYHLNEKFNVVFEILNIKYRDNFFAITEVKILKLDSRDILPKKMIVKGNFPTIFKGNIYEAEVCISEHLQFGFFLKLLNVPKEKVSNSENGLVNFLKSHTKSVTKNEAKVVVDTLGIDLIDKIKENPNALDNVELSKKKKLAIKKSVLNHWNFEKLLIFLQLNNINSNVANLIYDKFEDECFSIIYKHPYRLIEIKGLDFKIIDFLVKNNEKINFTKKERLEAIIVSIINKYVENLGYTCVEKDIIKANIKKFTDIYASIDDNNFEDKLIEEVFTVLIDKEIIVIDKVSNKDYVYFKYLYKNENNLAARIVDLNTKLEVGEKIATNQQIEDFIKQYEKDYSLTLAEGQKNAILMALNNKLSILTGGPGTGKTQTINTILKCIKTLSPETTLSLMAPTGKASNRMSELTGESASTIHRAIKLNGFIKDNETQIVNSDFIIIDECSMIDSYLFEQLLLNVKTDAKILFVGDANQLPSVGAGNVFKHLIDCNTIPTTELTEIFRQSLSSKIITNSHKLIKGNLSQDLELNDKQSDFHFKEENSSNKILEITEKMYEWLLRNKQCSVEDICILAPIKDSEIGTHNLNRAIQNKINPCKNKDKEYAINDIDVLRVNDRVMQTVNNYELGVMNGEVGIVTDISEYNNSGLKAIYVEYKDKDEPVCYTGASIPELTLAYACSIHKMQGSEVPYIINIIHGSQKNMLNRNLVYTAWTRAKKEIFVIGQKEALDKAINNISSFKRQSLLKEKIIKKTKEGIIK
jgi:exodeoxyribonuclease V alpha subunit